MENLSTPIDVVGLRDKLSKLTSEQLRQEFITMDIESSWKGGMNKAALVEKGIAAFVEKNTVAEQSKEEEVETIPEGEYDVDQDLLDEFPELSEQGFNIGDVLVVVEGESYSKKPVEQVKSDLDESDGTADIGTRKTIELVDKEIKEANKDIVKEDSKEEDSKEEDSKEEDSKEEDSKEYVPEVIDEKKYSIEELEENIELCQANCSQALPATKVFLLRKIDALTLALERKRK